MSGKKQEKRGLGCLGWILISFGLVALCLVIGVAALWISLSRPKVNTEIPSAEDVAVCRAMFLLHPELEIQPLGYFRLESLDISHGFKFIAKAENPVELLDEQYRHRIQFRKGFEGGFLSRGDRVSWWNQPREGVVGGDFLEVSDNFIWHSSMGCRPNGDGTFTVWAYAESGANVSERDIASSERLEFRGHSYQLVVDKNWLNWDDAEARCKAMGGNLVVINDQEENDFLAQLRGVGSVPCFLGARFKQGSEAWEWVDGTPLSYQNWIEGQPLPIREEDNFLRSQPLVWPGWCAFPGTALGFICEWEITPAD